MNSYSWRCKIYAKMLEEISEGVQEEEQLQGEEGIA
jgi:hypothetical protein